MTRSLDAARHAYPGYDPSHVSAVSVDLKQNGYDEAQGRLFYRRLLDAVRADGGVESVTLAAYTPMAFLDTPSSRVALEGYEPRRDEDLAFLSNIVGPDYFRTLRINVTAGHAFEERDDEDAAPVAMVNSTLAQKFWGGAGNAIGKRLRVADGKWRTIIGVASDVKYIRIDEPPRPYFYLPYLQSYRPRMILHTKGAAPVDTLVKQARAEVVQLDANLPVLDARPLADLINGATMLFTLAAAMLFVFGIAGMALAALGTYGLVSYTVKQSTHEIGIRIALGASRYSVVRRFLARGLKLAGIGAAIGVVMALAVTRMLGALLYGVSATDVSSFASALAIVISVVAVATLVPAWRASRMNPLSALRHQ